MDRRQALKGCLCGLISVSPLIVNSDTEYSDASLVEVWMDGWMDSLGSVSGALHIGRFADPTYYLTEEIGWSPNEGQSGTPVTVPVGFVTDFASIPRVFWQLLRPDGIYTFPAIIHDYLYWEQTKSRKESDEIFRNAMNDFEVNSVTVETIYRAVRIGGSVAWKKNFELRSNGEKRLICEYPTDPRTRWKEFKLNQSAFENC